MTLAEIQQFQKHVEAVFVGTLGNVCPNIYNSRSTEINQTPRAVVKANIGEQFQNQKLPISQAPGWIYSTYQGAVTVTVATNRTTEKDSDAHNLLVGQVGNLISQFNVTAFQNAQPETPPILVFDIRPIPNEDSIIDIDDVDQTMITVAILFAINPQALQTNL